MGKKKKKKKAPEGATLPLCTALFICEKIIVSKDEVLSAVRIVDHLALAQMAGVKPGDPVELGAFTVLATVKKGGAKDGDFDVSVSCTGPTGHKDVIGSYHMTLEGPANQHGNMLIPLRVRWFGEGMYWLNLETDAGDTIARSPFGVAVPRKESRKEDKA